jgi:hypothetical protein
MEAIWVPVVAILSVFGLPVGAFIVFRVLAHRERMEMIRHGIMPQVGKATRMQNMPPAYGQAPAGGGAGATDATVMLGKGIRTAFIGLALTIGLSFIGYHHDEFSFGPWMLGGLIPLFVGLSQITIAYLTDPSIFARFRGQSGGNGARPPYSEPPPHEPANGNSGSYTYRPGGTQELRPPTPPPTKWP